jgi:hypothetical protein
MEATKNETGYCLGSGNTHGVFYLLFNATLPWPQGHLWSKSHPHLYQQLGFSARYQFGLRSPAKDGKLSQAPPLPVDLSPPRPRQMGQVARVLQTPCQDALGTRPKVYLLNAPCVISLGWGQHGHTSG